MSTEPFMELVGIFDNQGNRYEPGTIPKPRLCAHCREDDRTDRFDYILCTLARLEHLLEGGDEEFICHAYTRRDDDAN